MNNFGMRFMEFMRGRRGNDEFGIFLLVLAIILSILSSFIKNGIIYYASIFILAYQVFRFMSRNIPKRYQENEKFLSIWMRFKNPGKNRQKKTKNRPAGQKTKTTTNVVYRYFNCPECGQKMRAPNGKGRIRVTCPRCTKQFETLV